MKKHFSTFSAIVRVDGKLKTYQDEIATLSDALMINFDVDSILNAMVLLEDWDSDKTNIVVGRMFQVLANIEESLEDAEDLRYEEGHLMYSIDIVNDKHDEYRYAVLDVKYFRDYLSLMNYFSRQLKDTLYQDVAR